MHRSSNQYAYKTKQRSNGGLAAVMQAQASMLVIEHRKSAAYYAALKVKPSPKRWLNKMMINFQARL